MDNRDNNMAITSRMAEVCGRIKQTRKLLKISQKDFAASVGMSQGHLCIIEKRERAPSVTLLKAICHEYHINPDWLTAGEGEQFASSATVGIPVFEHLPENYPDGTKARDIIGHLSFPGLPNDGFAVYQRGDYMTPTIQARDLVVCDPSAVIANDDLVLVKNRWETWIIRRVRKVGDKIVLTPDNPAYHPFEFGEGVEHILAKVLQVLRSVNY